MRRERLRKAHNATALDRIYPVPHDHRMYGRGHGKRVDRTIELAHQHLPMSVQSWSGADLSCGNGQILASLWLKTRYFGDYAYHPDYEYSGDIAKNLKDLPAVDVFILSETLEHLDRPDDVLSQIARKARWLVLTTPLEAWDDSNEEHYWCWDGAAVSRMLADAGFIEVAFDTVDSREYDEPYLYGIWIARRF